ncbi:MAG: carboxypeptidase M32, partial [Candidatus Bipolaricaulota bacterium]
KLVPFIKQLREEGTRPRTEVLDGTFPINKQEELSLRVLKAMGYDFSAGRLDTTIHPFTISTGPRDTRVTTRFSSNNLFSGIFSTMHEGGHALYQQGIPSKLHWSGLDEGASSGIHESQSQMWENMVGKQLPFLKYFQPILASVFPKFARTRPEILYDAVNTVTPSLIRVEADEATYNLHIMLRFELEEQLISGRIDVGDLPELWQDAMKRYLGVVPKDDAHGVLQDVHWSAGMFGYFSSYMLGNLYSAQIFAKVREEIPDLDEQIANGKSIVLLSWLRKKVHRFGKMYEPQDLLQRITGEKLNPSYFTRYITDKYSQIYKL